LVTHKGAEAFLAVPSSHSSRAQIQVKTDPIALKENCNPAHIAYTSLIMWPKKVGHNLLCESEIIHIDSL
jgi:hypothetical protein